MERELVEAHARLSSLQKQLGQMQQAQQTNQAQLEAQVQAKLQAKAEKQSDGRSRSRSSRRSHKSNSISGDGSAGSTLEQLRSEVFFFKEKSRTLEEIARTARRSSAAANSAAYTARASGLSGSHLHAPLTPLFMPPRGLNNPLSSSAFAPPSASPSAPSSPTRLSSTMDDLMRVQRKFEFQSRLREKLDESSDF